MPTHRARFVALTDLLARTRPDVSTDAIADGRVLVDGRRLTNPAARVRADAGLRVVPERRLRGDIKLSHAIDALSVDVVGRVGVDVGASAGGFTTALLAHGAAVVYAVDVGVGQLRGSLRNDARVVNLEGHNVAELTKLLIPGEVSLIVIDLSYLSVADAIPQLERLDISPSARLLALVKPTFELRRGRLAAAPGDVDEAIRRAVEGIEASRWVCRGTCAAPSTGQRGSREAFVHAARASSSSWRRGLLPS